MIETSLADFNGTFNIMFSIGDIRDVLFGSANKSYTIDLPLTGRNKNLLKYITQADVKSEPTEKIRLYMDDQLIIFGKIIVLSYNELSARIIISCDDWMDPLQNAKMTALDLSADDHLLTSANVEASWSSSYPMYRYPMIDFGGLQSGAFSPTARWYPTDFIPMISISRLITKIFEGYVISSSWLSSAYIKDLYILGKETIADSAFIEKKGFEVTVTNLTDNQQSGSSSTTIMVTLTKTMLFSTIVLDEASGWAAGTYYTIPVTGTYRFQASVKLSNTGYGNGNLTITNEEVTLAIMNGTAYMDNVSSSAYGATELIHDVTYTVDSGYCHCVAGDQIKVTIFARCQATINSGTQTITISTQTVSNFESLWGNANKYIGLNKNVSLEEMLPDVTQLDFLADIRDIFNLRFWMDRNNRTIYIEPWDTFVSSSVIDLTEFLDHESKPAELISQNYSKTIRMKFKQDTSDIAFTEYLKHNSAIPGGAEITLSSLFTKPGTDEREHPYSGVIEGYNNFAASYTPPMPIIWNVLPEYPFATFDRKVNFNTRIVHWDGLTSGFTWYYGSAAKTQYPKISSLDWVDIYNDYWQRFFHWVDKGKLYTLRFKVKPSMLAQFLTVINNGAAEGFRTKYKVELDGSEHVFVLQKIVSDGQMAEMELIIQ